MGQYINKAKLAAELEKAIDGLVPSHDQQCPWEDGYYCGLCKAKSIINILETKEINNVWHNAKRTIPEDGIEQIICIKEDGLAVSTVGKIVNGTIKWAYLNDLLDTSSFNINVKEEDLEKEILRVSKNEYFDFTDWKSIARHFYELGLKAKGE